MERTYILGNSPTLEKFEGYTVQVPQFSKESEMHDWVIELFKESVKHVIIEISENPIRSLQIGYHIRLSIEELGEQSLIPIFFISDLSLNEVLIKSEIYSQILSTKGVFFSLFDLESNKEEAKYILGLAEHEYLVKFLKVIQIQPDEKIGRHSLANKWGVYAFSKAANAESTLKDSDYKKELYFKYISAFNNINKLKPSTLNVVGRITLGGINKIEATGKRILLIDDEADNGWYDILRKTIKTSTPDDFKVINERIKTYESFSDSSRKTIENEEFDLYLVDLRLSGLDEDENLDSQMFSGMSVLDKLKQLNKGNQVIIFTASNKVWNLQSLINAGANGYYLKESPSYMFSSKLSKQKFIDFKIDVERCLAKNYLRGIFKLWKTTKELPNNSDFINESNAILDMAWELIEGEQLDFGYLLLFQAIEGYASRHFISENDSRDIYVESNLVLEWINDDEIKWYLKFNKEYRGDYFSLEENVQESGVRPTTLFKVSCLLHFKFGRDDQFLKRFGQLNKLRNDIAHRGVKRTTQEDLLDILMVLNEIRKHE